jgi:TolA-binding protein
MSTANQKCAGCRKALPRREHIKCINCKGVYDLECANISPKLFNLMERKEWKCPECLSKRPKMGNTNTPVHNTSTSLDHNSSPSITNLVIPHDIEREYVTQRREKPNQSTPPSPTIQTSSDNYVIRELKTYMADLIHNSTHSIRDALNDLANTIKDQNERIRQLEARVTDLENKAEQTHPNNISALESTIAQLKADMSERDQSLLSNDIEISGCPELPNENCTHLVLLIATKAGMDLEEKDIVTAYRAGPAIATSTSAGPTVNKELVRPRPLVVRFARSAPQAAMLKTARVRRNLTTEGLQIPGPIKSIYINERLTKHNRLLFRKARDLARELNYRYAWTRDGKIFVCQGQGQTRHRIRTEDDLQRVFAKTNIRS